MSTILLTNNVQLDSNSLLIGIDTSNVIALLDYTGSTERTYTATENCWISITTYGTGGILSKLFLDSVEVTQNSGSVSSKGVSSMFLKAGQTVAWTPNGKTRLVVFGLL